MTDLPTMASPQKPCHGCAHSASSAPFPGHPSGERPCGFCKRNPDGPFFSEAEAKWYDGETKPVKYPMDCYIATDRLTQERVFNALDRIEHGELIVPPRNDGFEFYRSTGMPEDQLQEAIRDGAPTCCEPGPVNGHSYDCIYVIGISYG